MRKSLHNISIILTASVVLSACELPPMYCETSSVGQQFEVGTVVTFKPTGESARLLNKTTVFYMADEDENCTMHLIQGYEVRFEDGSIVVVTHDKLSKGGF